MRKELSREEFLDKYGKVEVTFSSYYKYTFNFKSQENSEGKTILVCVGGCADDIYREEVVNGETNSIEQLYPYSGYVRDSNGDTIESFYDF